MTEVGETSEQQEKQNSLANFLNKAFDLARNNKFKETMQYLANKKFASTLGIELESMVLTISKPQTPENLDYALRGLRFKSGFIKDPQKLNVPYVALVKEKWWEKTPKVPSSFWHDISLIALEEWIHAAQHLKGKNFTEEKDADVDVKNYLKLQGIQTTELFDSYHQAKKI